MVRGGVVPKHVIAMHGDDPACICEAATSSDCSLYSVHAAAVRVRPAFAGEGRYFVRVPNGEDIRTC